MASDLPCALIRHYCSHINAWSTTTTETNVAEVKKTKQIKIRQDLKVSEKDYKQKTSSKNSFENTPDKPFLHSKAEIQLHMTANPAIKQNKTNLAEDTWNIYVELAFLQQFLISLLISLQFLL